MSPEGQSKGNVLVAYIVEPFLVARKENISRAHTHHIESVAIAETFLKLNYCVDVIDYRNAAFVPEKNYDFFVSARTNFRRVADRLNADCIKIAHLDTAHFLFNNAAAFRRLLDLQRRRNASVSSLKQIEKNWAPESCDYISVLGNEFTLDTYRYAGKQMFPLPVPTLITHPSPQDRDFSSIRKNYLWLGSAGLVHKGLDLVLEAFTQMPEYRLTVCGPLDAPSEKEFKRIYHKELYETENIQCVGWTDVGSPEFADIAKTCVALIYPSCSEGQSGGVVTCMHAGMIPVISYESGVDVEDFGLILDDCSVDNIQRAVQQLSALPASELASRALATWQYAQTNHSQDEYMRRFEAMIQTIERTERERATR